MFCSNCGNKLEKNFNFCNKCGTKIKKDSVFIEKKETEEKQSKVEIIDILLMLAPISTFMIYLTINTLKITGFLGIILGILIGIFFLILILLIQQLFSSVKHSLKNYHKNKENEKEKKYNQQSFTGADIIKNCDSKKTIAIKNSWNRFIVMFWIFFVIKTVILSNKSDPPNTLFYKQLGPYLLIISIYGIAILVIYYLYKFSIKKLYCLLYGLFWLIVYSFLWFLVFGDFIGYFIVQHFKNIQLEEVEKIK